MTKRETVLFVDDEENILNSLRRGLIDEDYHCLFASSGIQALEILQKEPVSVIVSDMRMPGMDGLTLLKEVKNKYPKTVRIVLSGYAQIQQIIATLNQADLFKFIMKPWKLEEEFKGVIQQALDYHRLQEEREELEETLKMKNLAYQNILKNMEEVMQAVKKDAEFHAQIGHLVSELMIKEINEGSSSATIKRKFETTTAILDTLSEIILFEKSEKDMVEFIEEIKDNAKSYGVTTLDIKSSNEEIIPFKCNFRLIHRLLKVAIDLLSGDPENKHINISHQIEIVDGVRKPSLIFFIDNKVLDKTKINGEFEIILDLNITVLNSLLSHILKLYNGNFHCARVDKNVVAKFCFPA